MNIVFPEIKRIAIGSIICNIVFLIASALFSLFSKELFLGSIIGTVYAIVNFMLIGVSVSDAMKKTPKQAQISMVISYFIRMAITALVIFIGLSSDYINPIGVIIPLFFPKAVLYARSIFRKEANR